MCAPVGRSLMTFECAHCGAVLSVPREKAGVSGPCPACGEWLVSPHNRRAALLPADVPMMELGREPAPARAPKFAARTVIGKNQPRMDIAASAATIPPQLPVDWQMRRVRRSRGRNWFERRQLPICIIAFVLCVSLVAALQSMGWKLPIELSEDSALMQFIEGFGKGSRGVPTTIGG